MSGITKHSRGNLSYSGTLTIAGKLTSEDNKICIGSANAVIESNAVGTYDVSDCFKAYAANGLTDYFHISGILPYQSMGATPKVTSIELYVTDITAPDKVDRVRLRHADLTTGTITTDWEDDDDKSGTDHTISYTGVDITLAENCAYWIEVALDAGGTGFHINGFGIVYDLV